MWRSRRNGEGSGKRRRRDDAIRMTTGFLKRGGDVDEIKAEAAEGGHETL